MNTSMSQQVCFSSITVLKPPIFLSTPEDTFILLDALEQDMADLQQMNATVCLEIG